MAKRKTIRVNPLDTLVPDPTTRRTGVRRLRRPKLDPLVQPRLAPEHPHGGSSPEPRTAIHPRQPRRLHSRPLLPISSAASSHWRKQNEYIKWLVGGAILLAIML